LRIVSGEFRGKTLIAPPGAIVVFERGASEGDVAVEGYDALDARDYGAARVVFLRFAG
jgi:16S rRNA (guanine966-N2)-methyltransferase